KQGNFGFRVYSDYPFPSRQADGSGGIQDRFERDALNYFRNNRGNFYYQIVDFNNRRSMRAAMPITMKASCLACHNTHPESPKTNWRIGDVRGVMSLIQPLDNFIEQNERNLAILSLRLGGIAILALLGISLVFGKLRKSTKELESTVRARTAQLTEANINLESRNGLIRQVFGQYMSNDVVTILIKNAANKKLKLGGEKRKITILTSDLRGFTAISESRSPEEVIKILNIYLSYMTDVIDEYHGIIDEFLGDGILVLFGTPIVKEDDASRAIACACAMQLKMGAVNECMKQMGLPTLEMGIGINTGEVVVGNIGSEKRTKYGVVGSPVNLAYRIESHTTGGQILISETTLKEVESIVKIAGQKQIKAKGIEQPISIYYVWGISGFYNLFLPREEEQFFPLQKKIPIQYSILEGKNISAKVFRGHFVKLSLKGAQIRINSAEIDSIPAPYNNLKLNIVFSKPTNSRQVSEDIYAKVLDTTTLSDSFYVTFTFLPPSEEARITKIYHMINQINQRKIS
ncbi:MAG: adenylate/guanylate cyclase domain-containing protein, partial [Cyanobacteria bacterium P01_G01_bin.39]